MRNPGKTFFQIITPSDISYILSLVKNGKDVWDQDDRMAANPHGNPEKKLQPLFTSRGERNVNTAPVDGQMKGWSSFTPVRTTGR